MTTPINTELNLTVTTDQTVVDAAILAKSGYDDADQSPLNHNGETYIIVDKQTYAELEAAIASGAVGSIDGLSQECVDILAGAEDGITLLCREHTNSRFFRIEFVVAVAP